MPAYHLIVELVLRYLQRVGSPADPRDRAFHTFARLEHAMKLSGFERRREDRRADTDWSKLAREFGRNLPEDRLTDVGKRAVRYLVDEPPKVELIGEATLEWEREINAATTIERAILHVRRVRNNLVHGGKAVNYRLERDGRLLDSCPWL